jgi:hypothetical protein
MIAWTSLPAGSSRLSAIRKQMNLLMTVAPERRPVLLVGKVALRGRFERINAK